MGHLKDSTSGDSVQRNRPSSRATEAKEAAEWRMDGTMDGRLDDSGAAVDDAAFWEVGRYHLVGGHGREGDGPVLSVKIHVIFLLKFQPLNKTSIGQSDINLMSIRVSTKNCIFEASALPPAKLFWSCCRAPNILT